VYTRHGTPFCTQQQSADSKGRGHKKKFNGLSKNSLTTYNTVYVSDGMADVVDVIYVNM
jgi:hypothetical protein